MSRCDPDTISIREIASHDSCIACTPTVFHGARTRGTAASRAFFTTASGFSPARRGARRPRSDAGRASCSRQRPALIAALAQVPSLLESCSRV